MLHRFVNQEFLCKWLIKITSLNFSYYRVRKDAWMQFASNIHLSTSETRDDCVEITNVQYNTLNSYFTSRNDKISDDLLLSYQNTINELMSLVTVETSPNPLNQSDIKLEE